MFSYFLRKKRILVSQTANAGVSVIGPAARSGISAAVKTEKDEIDL